MSNLNPLYKNTSDFFKTKYLHSCDDDLMPFCATSMSLICCSDIYSNPNFFELISYSLVH